MTSPTNGGLVVVVVLMIIVFIVLVSFAFARHACERHAYLDNNGTTKIFDESLALMEHVYKHYYGNASAIYLYGEKSKRILDLSRDKLSTLLVCKPEELFFTSGATESNNILIRGIYHKYKHKGNHVIISSIEHPSVFETVKSLPNADVTIVPVDKQGNLDLNVLASSIRDDTILVCVIMGNNEIGTIQDVKTIAKICNMRKVHLHLDMTQVVGKYKIDLQNDVVCDSASASGHKFHGPKSTGFLYVKNGKEFQSCMSGGHQERNMRSGTENIPGIVAMTYSLFLCYKRIDDGQSQRIKAMRDWMREQLIKRIEGCIVNGNPEHVLYNTLSLCLPVDSRRLISKLDKVNVSINTGSACSKGASSRILDAIGLPKDEQKGSVRISLSFLNTWGDCKRSVSKIVYLTNKMMHKHS